MGERSKALACLVQQALLGEASQAGSPRRGNEFSQSSYRITSTTVPFLSLF
jgi:hypothetical protein